MAYQLLADTVIFVHFLWIVFMLVGFFWTVFALFFSRGFFERWFFRSLHLCGIFYVGILTILGKYCPLTTLENWLRTKYDPYRTYSGSFIAHYLEQIVFPDVNPLIITISTIFLALFTVVVFAVKPPQKIRTCFKRRQSGLP